MSSFIKTYNRWKMFRLAINLGIPMLDFFGKKYDERKVSKTQLADGISVYKYLRSLSVYGNIKSFNDVVIFIKENNWSWVSDPLKGYFDYKSKPLMTVAKKSGDCDDFATLWCDLYPWLDRYAIFSDNPKEGHVVAVGRLVGDSSFIIASNMELSAIYNTDTAENALLSWQDVWFKGGRRIHCIMKYSKEGKISEIKVYK